MTDDMAGQSGMDKSEFLKNLLDTPIGSRRDKVAEIIGGRQG